jgi:hypothetical protein
LKLTQRSNHPPIAEDNPMTFLPRTVLAAAALAAALLTAGSAHAGHRSPLVALELYDRDTGQPLPIHEHRGRSHVPGTPGHRYAVRLRNHSPERVLVVLSVDGVNAVTGEDADPQQSGYVLEPGQTADINGWRKSLSDVAQFVFTDLDDSYAARTGRPANVGVVGIAVFREKPRPASPPLASALLRERSKASAEAPAALRDEAESVGRSLGTGHGQREWAPTRHTAFQRASRRPAQVSELHYDSRERLIAAGVIPVPQPIASVPRAFPGGFVPDPR